MALNIDLYYGREAMSFTLPQSAVVPEIREPHYAIRKEDFTSDLLQLLPADKAKLQRVSIVVSDKTRLCGYPEFLPWVTEALIQHGVYPGSICFYIAYGTHPRQTEEESNSSYGEVYKRYRFVHHDCRDDTAFAPLGTTSRGTTIAVRKDILDSTLLITFGSISHHYFAGYGGGRKLLFPGLGSREAIYHNHGLFLDRETRSLAAGCQPGILKGNPLAEDLREVDNYLPARISIHGIMNASGKVCQLVIGQSYDDFVSVCQVHDSFYRHQSTEQYDLVLASSGGYPKDINFIQAHKSVHHAAAFVRDGGSLIMLSECIDGIASDYFMKYLQSGSFEAAYAMLEKKYEGNGGTALSMMLKTGRIRIFMLTSMDEETCRILGVTKINSSGIQSIISAEKGSIAVIKNASMLIK
jgi:nickel-dependent lactate racemase